MCKYEHVHIYSSEHDARAAYNEYLERHKISIYNAYIKFGKQFCDCLGLDDQKLRGLVETHDQSMATSELEKVGFLAGFYPYEGDGMPLNEYGQRYATFEKALKAHYDANPHHPEHWIKVNRDINKLESQPMDKIYVAEMVLDWVSCEKDPQHIPTKDYWERERGMKFIHPSTILTIDELVSIVAGI